MRFLKRALHSCGRKQRHKSLGKAEAALRALARIQDVTNMHPYLCIHCRQWHIGHRRGSRSNA
jgi:hypothetical protein